MSKAIDFSPKKTIKESTKILIVSETKADQNHVKILLHTPKR
jgi:hypothetical protein